jgi:hypothetical protein
MHMAKPPETCGPCAGVCFFIDPALLLLLLLLLLLALLL